MKLLRLKLKNPSTRFVWQERFPETTSEEANHTIDPYKELLAEIEQENLPQADDQLNDYQKWEVLQEQEPIFLAAFNDIKQEFCKVDYELYNERKQGAEIDYTKYEQYLINAYGHLCTLDEAYQKIKAVELHNIQPFDKASLLHTQYSYEKYGHKETVMKELTKSNEQLGGVEDEYIMAKAIIIEMEHLVLDRAEGEKTVGVMVREKADGSYEYFSKQYGVSDRSKELAKKGMQPRGIELNPELQQARSSIDHINIGDDEKASWGARLIRQIRQYILEGNVK